MTLLNTIREHPLPLALALVVSFTGWVAYDMSSGVRRHDAPIDAPALDAPNVVMITVPPETDFGDLQTRDPSKPGVVTADMIPRLVPGMARVAVEELIGQPPAGLVHPVAMVDGKYIYRATYLANLDIKPTSPLAARSIIALEYDAGSPGHPLLRVHIPDPMS